MFCSDVKTSAALRRYRAGVGTIWEVSKLGGLNIKKCLQPRRTLREKSCSRVEAGSRPTPLLGKADDREEGTGMCTPWDRRGMGPGIRGKIRRDNVGKIPVAAGVWWQPTCKDSSIEAEAEVEESQSGLADESVGATTEE